MDERFWEKVDCRSFDECWPWRNPKHPQGYGLFNVDGRPVLAHRVAFFLTYGRWPTPCGLHGCDNPPCCNALNLGHVHEGTHADNSREMVERGRNIDLRGLGNPHGRLSDRQIAGPESFFSGTFPLLRWLVC